MNMYSSTKIHKYLEGKGTEGLVTVRGIEKGFKGIEENTPTDTIKVLGVVVSSGVYGVYTSKDEIVSHIVISDGLEDVIVCLRLDDYLKYEKGDVVEIEVQRVINTGSTMGKLKEVERSNKIGLKRDTSFTTDYIKDVYVMVGEGKVRDKIDVELEKV